MPGLVPYYDGSHLVFFSLIGASKKQLSFSIDSSVNIYTLWIYFKNRSFLNS